MIGPYLLAMNHKSARVSVSLPGEWTLIDVELTYPPGTHFCCIER